MNALERYDRIALDLDGTLIDGINSPILQQFVLDHPNKKFWIVSFRTTSQLENVNEDLEHNGLRRSDFKRIIPMPERLYFEYDEDQRRRRVARLPTMDRPDASLFPGEYRVVHWKGYVCRHVGARVLVDDMANLVLPGCREYGIDFVDALSLRQYALMRESVVPHRICVDLRKVLYLPPGCPRSLPL